MKCLDIQEVGAREDEVFGVEVSVWMDVSTFWR